jgi:hypothetical protein
MADVRFQDLRGDAGQDSTWSKPAKLSCKVRELAHPSHRVLRGRTRPAAVARPGSDNIQGDLRDLRDQIARLQRKVFAPRIGALVPWVDALGKQVEKRLYNEVEAGAR